MNGTLLRKIRISVSSFFLIATTLLLVDIYGFFPPEVSNKILFLQFIPSTLKFISVVSLGAAGFIIVIILSLLFGRVYCSTICPLGIFQDIINWLSGKFRRGKKRRFDFSKEQKILRIVLLILPVLFFLLGSSLLLNLLDPYSIYGRFSGNFFRPVAAGVNNIAAYLFEIFRIYAVYPYSIKAFNPFPFLFTLSFFSFVVIMAWTKGRLYCNTVCPVGTLLGYLSKFSLFKIIINHEECLSCGICAKECKSSCIDSKNKTVDMSRCVVCFDCIPSCPTEGITFGNSYKKNAYGKNEQQNIKLDHSKRDFLTKTSVYLFSLSAIAAQVQKKIIVTKPSTVPVFRKNAVSPPGSEGLEKFNSRCTACNLCVSACPTQVLQPSFLEYGFLGMLQPRLDNITGFCNFECKICGDVCPTGAILPMDLEKKKLTQLGKAKFVKDNCIVKTQKTDCGACSEHCPTKAVHMIPFEGTLVIPEVRDDYCIGCGACEFACPTNPYKAIYVEGNRWHQIAKKNVELKKQESVNTKEDFPF
ncbi:MAG: 4Fe-4S binding protein [Melioribacteraceae bacterium]